MMVIENWLLAVNDMGSRRLSISVIWGVANSAYQWYGELPTSCINNTRSHRLPVSMIQGAWYWIFKKKTLRIDDAESRSLPAPVIRGVVDTSYRWYGESTTLRIGDMGIRYRGVWKKGLFKAILSTPSYHRCGESIFNLNISANSKS